MNIEEFWKHEQPPGHMTYEEVGEQLMTEKWGVAYRGDRANIVKNMDQFDRLMCALIYCVNNQSGENSAKSISIGQLKHVQAHRDTAKVRRKFKDPKLVLRAAKKAGLDKQSARLMVLAVAARGWDISKEQLLSIQGIGESRCEKIMQAIKIFKESDTSG